MSKVIAVEELDLGFCVKTSYLDKAGKEKYDFRIFATERETTEYMQACNRAEETKLQITKIEAMVKSNRALYGTEKLDTAVDTLEFLIDMPSKKQQVDKHLCTSDMENTPKARVDVSFSHALQYAICGHTVRRSSWDDKIKGVVALRVDVTRDLTLNIMTELSKKWLPYLPSPKDLFANDWYIRPDLKNT